MFDGLLGDEIFDTHDCTNGMMEIGLVLEPLHENSTQAERRHTNEKKKLSHVSGFPTQGPMHSEENVRPRWGARSRSSSWLSSAGLGPSKTVVLGSDEL